MSDFLQPSDFETPNPVDTTTDTSAPASTPSTPAPTPQDDLWEVKVNNRTFKVPREELIAGYQRQQDYTRKTMELAEQRRQADQIRREYEQFRNEREEIKRFLQDPAAMQEYLRQVQITPETPLTAAHLQSLQQQQAVAMEQRMAQMAQELEVRQLAGQYSTEINASIEAAMKQFPELRSVRRMEQILREEVGERRPSTLEEAKQLFLAVAKEQSDSLRAFAEAEKKRAVAQAATLNNGIEPPGGTGIQPAPQKFKLGSEDLRKAFEDSLRGN